MCLAIEVTLQAQVCGPPPFQECHTCLNFMSMHTPIISIVSCINGLLAARTTIAIQIYLCYHATIIITTLISFDPLSYGLVV